MSRDGSSNKKFQCPSPAAMFTITTKIVDPGVFPVPLLSRGNRLCVCFVTLLRRQPTNRNISRNRTVWAQAVNITFPVLEACQLCQRIKGCPGIWNNPSMTALILTTS